MSGRRTTVALAALLLVSLPGHVARARQEERTAGLPITGRVVFEGGEAPASCLVYLSPVDGPNDDSTRIRVDESGAFASAPLTPGLYSLFAIANGYGNEKDGNEYFRPGETITLKMRKTGAITGMVTDESGEPLGGIRVQVLQVRDARGKALPQPQTMFYRDRYTDDRGIYRIFGLGPGSYVIMAGRSAYARQDDIVAPRNRDPVVYHPSSGRRDAVEVKLDWGEERAGIDIRFVRKKGSIVAGTVVAGSIPEGGDVEVTLYDGDGTSENEIDIEPSEQEVQFSFPGVPDGEYEIVATGRDDEYEDLSTARRRVTVRKGDVRGVRLVLGPIPPPNEIAGRVSLDPAEPNRPETCPVEQPPVSQVGLIGIPRRNETTAKPFGDRPVWKWVTSPQPSGEFRQRELRPATYRLGVDLPSDDWYVRGVSRGPKGDPSLHEIALATGQKVADLVAAIGRGAAGVAGRLETPRPGVVVYLVPAEAPLADNLWRYGEAVVEKDGTFAIKHLAPGKYWLLARPLPKDEEDSPLWDRAKRAALRAEAEAAKQPLDLAPCQRAKDVVAYTFSFSFSSR